jgi:N-6 DNA Methylase
MPRSPVKQALVDYARLVRQDLSAATAAGIGPAVEPTLHDRFRTLLENLLPAIFPAGGAATLPNVLVEYNSRTIGRPDIALAHRGQFAKSFVELKIPSHRLNPNQLRGHDKEQFERFCDLPVWGYSNFYEIHLYRRSELVSEAQIIPRLALDPTTSDARAETLIDVHDPTGFAGIVEALVLAQPPVPRSAEEVATSIAHAARLIRGVVLDLARGLPPGGALVTSALYLVREEFRDVLYARPTAGGHGSDEEFSDLFASAFAQTLAYGLLLARESSGREVGHDAYNLINHALHPLLAVTLQALLQPQITNDLGGALQVLLDAVNVVDPALLTRRPGSDPILYFYEDFIAVFDRKTKDKYGIFYTPVEVVKFQVAEVDRVLRDELKTDGLLDATVHVLDPATGTGTYLVAATAAAADRARTMFGGAAVPAELRSLASRL